MDETKELRLARHIDQVIDQIRIIYPNFNSIPLIDNINCSLIDWRNALEEGA